MPRIARVWTDLDLDSSGFSVGLKKARAEAKASSAAIQKELAGIRTSITAGLGAVAGLGLMGAARDALDYASSLGEVASQLGVTTKDLQQYRYVATQVGVSQETMDKSLAKLTVTMGKARAGSKEQSAAFRELNGLIGKDILASAQTAGDAIPLIAEALGKIEDPTKRARLEVALFGKMGQQLDPMLKDGARGVNELRDAAQSLGIVLSDRQIQDADQTADKLSELNTVLSARIAGVVADNANAIYTLADALAKAAAESVNFAATYPRATGVAAGAAAGTKYGGPLGGLVGGILGFHAGNEVAKGNSDIKFRKAEFRRARDIYRQAKGTAVGQDAAERLAEQERLLRAAIAAGARRPDVSVPRPGSFVGTPTASTPAAPKRGGTGGRGGRDAIDKAERARIWAEDQIARAKIDELSAQDQIVGSYTSRYALAVARIDADRADFARELKDREGLTAAQKRELTAANEAVLAKELELADQEKYRAQQREAFQLFAAQNDAQQEATRAQIDTARTARDRRDAELRLLDLQKQAEKAQLELVLATETTASAASDNARRRLAGLDGVYADRAAAVKRDTMGPMARYLDDMPKTAAEIGEAYERAAVRGIDSMNDALGESIKRTLGLKGVVGDLIAELVLLQAKKALFSDGAGGGGLMGTIAGYALKLAGGSRFDAQAANAGAASAAAGLARNVPRMATGGSMIVGGTPGIDRNVLSINGRPRALVSAAERIDVTPPKLRAGGDPISITIVAEEGSAFNARVGEVSRGETALQMGAAARAQGRARRRALVR